MATKKEKVAPKKKEPPKPPTPERCLCGRIPTAVKGRGGWTVLCPSLTDCALNVNPGKHKSLDGAVEAWNTLINSARYKEAKK